jgi:pimeloyl-ACP methyl ester carboxylesterase
MANIVLIHGAYQGGWIWRDTARALRAMGHDVYTPTLDGCAERAHQLRAGITTELHADELAEFLRCYDLDEVTIAGTSTGGMVACRLAEVAPARIGKVVLADALALDDGERLSDIVQRPQALTTALATGPTRDDAAGRLFAELDAPVRDWALERYTLHPLEVMQEAVELRSFWTSTWDAAVIWCRHSQNPPLAHQQRAAQRLDARWHELDTGHYPMLQAPTALAELIANG